MSVLAQTITIQASAARTATPTPSDIANSGWRGCVVTIDVTAAPGPAPSVVFTIQGKDPVSGKYYTILASAAITGVGTTVLRVYPGLTASGNLVVSDVLPPVFNVICTHGNGNSVTYSVGCGTID